MKVQGKKAFRWLGKLASQQFSHEGNGGVEWLASKERFMLSFVASLIIGVRFGVCCHLVLADACGSVWVSGR